MTGLSISIANDLTGRTSGAGAGPTADFWVTDGGDKIITDTADKLIFKLV